MGETCTAPARSERQDRDARRARRTPSGACRGSELSSGVPSRGDPRLTRRYRPMAAPAFRTDVRAIRKPVARRPDRDLTPDFLRKDGRAGCSGGGQARASTTISKTVPSRYLNVRRARAISTRSGCCSGSGDRPHHLTKSGIMSVSARAPRVLKVDGRLRSADVDFLTIGQYCKPTRKHSRRDALHRRMNSPPMRRSPKAKGFRMVSESPLTRS